MLSLQRLLIFLVVTRCYSVQIDVNKKGLKTELHKLVLFHGTKWCGPGQVANSYDDLGEYEETDKCCRQHDTECSVRIKSFGEKYDLINFSWKISSHCECERRFKECLERVGSIPSNALYKIYFELINPRCIRLKKVKFRKCAERNWYHKCIKYKFVEKKEGYFVDLHEALDIE